MLAQRVDIVERHITHRTGVVMKRYVLCYTASRFKLCIAG